MRKNILNISVIAVLSGFSCASVTAMAQDERVAGEPIFVTPYKRPAVQSTVPNIVNSTPQSKSQSSLNSFYDEAPEYVLVNDPDPWVGTSFGRLTEEINIFDKKTGNDYNQYDYLALLKQRGEVAAFNETAKYLQETGVFNPQKYQSAIANAAKGEILPVGAQAEEALDGGVGTFAETAEGDISGSGGGQAVKRRYVSKEDEGFAPKRVHQAYDKDMEDDAVAKPRKTQPIFLK